MDFEDQEEQEEEMDLHQESYESPPQPIKTAANPADTAAAAGISLRTRPRYRECLKNHAVGIGGHAVDGCGEFMAAGADGTLDGLRCAACGCHRNFHRKDTDLPLLLGPPARHALAPHHHAPPGGYYRAPPPPLQLALPPPPVVRDEYGEGVDASGSGSGSFRKRFRTKFTAEQKEKMFVLAEKIGWRIQKQDEEIVQRFCDETGVKRQVLKVWLHNNKHTLGKRQPTPD